MATKIAFEGKRELRWLEIGSVLACYMEPEVEFADVLWDQWMDVLRRSSTTALLLCSWGPTQPSHQQWRRATRTMRDRQLPVAMVTDARHNFALAKAASWLGTNIQAFHWGELDGALEFVKLGQGDRIAAKSTLVALRDRFGAVGKDAEFEQVRVLPPTPIADAHFSASSEVVFETNDEIQRKLAEIQARLTNRNRLVTATQD